MVPSGLKAAAVTLPECPVSLSNSLPLAASQSRRLRSPLQVNTHLPDASNFTSVPAPVWPLRCSVGLPEPASQTMVVRSAPAEAMVFPFGAKAHDHTGPLWPLNSRCASAASRLQTRRSLSLEEETS